jgi:hypothetical protein
MIGQRSRAQPCSGFLPPPFFMRDVASVSNAFIVWWLVYVIGCGVLLNTQTGMPLPYLLLGGSLTAAAMGSTIGFRCIVVRTPFSISGMPMNCTQTARATWQLILGVDQRERREGNVRAIGYRIERPDVSE